MKKSLKILSTVLAITILFCISASAVETRASAYIDSYFMDVIPAGNGVLAVEFSVEGTDTMTRIGAQSIIVYYKSGSNWVYDGQFTSRKDGMVDTNTVMHGNTMCYQGKIGTQYKVEVTVFAEDSTGSDSRTEYFILTAR